MPTLRLSDAAVDDIADIAAYIAKASGSLRIGEDFADQLLDRCEHMAALPGTMGRERPELRRAMRSSPYKGYVIFFRYLGDVLEVVNVLEGHRDIEGYFGAGD